MTHDFYLDRRYCDTCGTYVRYLLSPRGSYCVECGGSARLFSPSDSRRFEKEVRETRQSFALPGETDREAI